MVKCSQCGYDSIDNLNYCGKCGSKLDVPIFCSFCKTQNDNNSNFCSNCGKSLKNNIITESNQENTPYQQHSLNSKYDFKSLIIGSFGASFTYIILHEFLLDFLIRNVYYGFNGIPGISMGITVFVICLLSGSVGMYIFNDMTDEKYRPINNILLGIITFIFINLYYILMGRSVMIIGMGLVLLILIIIGAFIENYIEKNN